MKKMEKIVIAICVVAGIASLVIFLPQVREMIIGMGEEYVGRPLTHEAWHERFIQWEKIFLLADTILLAYIIFFFILDSRCNDMAETKKRVFLMGRLAELCSIPDFKKWVGISAIVFLAAHGYCFFNAMYNHDSLMIFQNDVDWQISLGRFLQPIYCGLFRGMIVAPWLICCLSFVFLMVSAYLILNLLNIRSIKNMCVATAMLITATTLTLSNATYIPWSDIYMLALLLAVSGAYVAVKRGRHFILSVACMALSMGLYQSYIQVAVVLLMFDVFRDVLKNKGAKDIVKKCAVYLCTLAASFVLYWCLVKVFQKICQVPMSDGYNGMSNVGRFGGFRKILRCFVGSYIYVLRSFINPITVLSAHKVYVFAARLTLLFSAAYAIRRILAKSKLSGINILFAVTLMALFPFGCNFVYFISQGMEHDLMTFSFAVAPLLVFPLLSMDEEVGGGLLTKRKNVVYACFALTVFSNVIFANQIYVKKDLEAKSTLSVVTRIIDRIEQTEGYVAGETEVCIIGGLEENPLVISKRAGFDYSGTGNQAWVAATHNIEHYISYYLAYPYKKYRGECPPAIAGSLEVFPEKNCATIQNGVLYIKIGGSE